MCSLGGRYFGSGFKNVPPYLSGNSRTTVEFSLFRNSTFPKNKLLKSDSPLSNSILSLSLDKLQKTAPYIMAKLMNAYSKVHFWSDSEGNIQQQQNPENNLNLLLEEATGKMSQ